MVPRWRSFRQMIEAQGGDGQVVSDPTRLPQARYKIELPAKTAGVVAKITADELGIASLLLGGGRQTKDDELDYAVGLELHKKVGDPVAAGDSLLTIHSNREAVDDIKQLLYDNIEIADDAQPLTLIHEIIN